MHKVEGPNKVNGRMLTKGLGANTRINANYKYSFEKSFKRIMVHSKTIMITRQKTISTGLPDLYGKTSPMANHC